MSSDTEDISCDDEANIEEKGQVTVNTDDQNQVKDSEKTTDPGPVATTVETTDAMAEIRWLRRK
eukprot:COSAG02_NODE_23785_length_708_cov_1.118227_1_plen_64_part_00